MSYAVASINPLGRFSVEDTRKDIPYYAFLDKYESFRKDENNNKSQNKNKNPAGFFFQVKRWELIREL